MQIPTPMWTRPGLAPIDDPAHTFAPVTSGLIDGIKTGDAWASGLKGSSWAERPQNAGAGLAAEEDTPE